MKPILLLAASFAMMILVADQMVKHCCFGPDNDTFYSTISDNKVNWTIPETCAYILWTTDSKGANVFEPVCEHPESPNCCAPRGG